MAASSFTVTGGGGGSISIGGPVLGGTDGSVLFINPDGILAEDNANFFYDTTNNRLGIGTNTPSRQLTINGLGLLTDQVTRWEFAGNPVSTIINDGTQNWFLDGIGRISYSTPTGQPGITFFTTTSIERSDFKKRAGGGFDFAAHALGTIPPNLMSIDVSGSVGIGTSTPAYRLEVETDAASALTDEITQWTNGSTGNPITQIRNNGTQNWFLRDGAGVLVGRITYATPTAQPGIVFFDELDLERVDIKHSEYAGGGLDFATHSLGTIPPIRMRIEPTSGFVLLDSNISVLDVATERLDVVGNITTRAQGEMKWQDAAGGEFVSFRAPAVVSSSQVYDLPDADGASGEVLTTDGSGILSWTAPVAGSIAIGASVTGSTVGSVLFVGAGPALAENNNDFFWDNATSRLGIGTTTPDSELHVVGDVHFTGKLTVDGAIDPTSLTLVDAGNAAYFESADGGSAAVAPVNTGRIIYDVATQKWRLSANGGAYADVATGSGGGITSLNALTGATQTFATGTTGTNFTISSVGTTHTFNIPNASAANRGLITTGTQTIAGVKTFSSLPTIPVTPVAPTDSASKGYVDTFASGLSVKLSVEVASTPAGGNLTLSGEQTIDGYLTSTSRILVKDQTSAIDNGIYVTAAGAWSRASDYNVSAEVGQGTFTVVVNGTVNANTQWVQVTPTPTLGVDDLVFSILNSGVYTASSGVKLVGADYQLDFVPDDGLILSGNSATIAYDGSTIGITANQLALLDTTVTAAGYGSTTQSPTFTVDAQGRLTAAANVLITPAASSITGGAALTRVNDTNVTLTLGGTPASSLLAATSLTLGWAGTLAATRGGTAQATYATGDIIYASAANTLSKLPIGTAGQQLTVAGGIPTWSSGGSGTVTSVSVVSANGLAGTVATATTTPAITLSTSVTGVLTGNGTAISALSLTSGSIPFSNGTTLVQDNANLFFDNTNNFLGVGTATPGATIEARTSAANSRTASIYAENTLASAANGTSAIKAIYSGTGSGIGINTAALVLTHNGAGAGNNVGVYGQSTGAGSGQNIALYGTATGNSGLNWAAYFDEGNIFIQSTTATRGVIFAGSSSFIHSFGTNNFFAGAGAGNLTLSGANDNVGIGVSTLASLTSGDQNVGVGYRVLDIATTAAANTGVGWNSLGAITTGSNNTAVGNTSLFGTITGSGNTGVGFASLFGSGGAISNNTAIGLSSGAAYTGSNNLALGASVVSVTTSSGSNNIAIGYSIELPVAANSNQMTIGNLIFGTGVNGAGTAISTGNIGVGISAPAARLHVNQGIAGNAVQTLSSTATNSDPSEIVYQNRLATTDATTTTLHTFTIPASTTYAIETIVIARRTGGAAGAAEDGARYKLSAVYKNVASVATIIGVVTSTVDESQAGWNCVFSPSGSTVRVQVTGALNNDITWHMTSRVYQVST